MNTIDFIELVREMRTTQKNWFRNHLRSDLIASKELEQRVDKALKDGVTVFETHKLTEPTEEQLQLDLDNAIAAGRGMRYEPDAGALLDTSAE